MTVRLGRVVVLVEDQDDALKFYVEALGCRVLHDAAGPDGRRFVHVSFGEDGPGVWLLQPAGAAGVQRVGSQTGGEPVAVLYTDEFDATLESWRSAGVHVAVDPYHADGARVCHIQDPYGNEFVLVQLP
jgi:catechol 2,3-dioxygenase-like lactoylglutathione lyase family enzyme